MRYLIAAAVLGLAGSSFAETINVPSDHDTIQGAINASSDGDVIAIAAGTYYEHSLNPNNKAITIQGTLNGDGSLATTIDAQQGGRVFTIESGEGDGTVIKDLVITGGLASGSWPNNCGGGISCWYSNPTISNCTISGNTADYGGGGGIYSYSSNPTITDCEISDNIANGGGGIYCDSGSNPTISGCTISGNMAALNAGGIGCDNSNPTISGSEICGNYPNQIYGPYTASESCIEQSCDTCAADSDADGVPDYLDQCPGEDDTIDTDSDGTPDCLDAFPNDPNEWADTDGDGMGDNEDLAIVGACCTSGGCDSVAEVTCASFGGTWLGEGGSCDDCLPAPPTGACCVSSGCHALTEDACAGMGGTWLGEGGSCDDCPASCMGDTDGNGVVNIEDLLNMLGSWGACP